MISQIELVVAIMNEISRQCPGVTTADVDMDAIVQSANNIKDTTDAKLAAKRNAD